VAGRYIGLTGAGAIRISRDEKTAALVASGVIQAKEMADNDEAKS